MTMPNEKLLDTVKLRFAYDHAHFRFGRHGRMNFFIPPCPNQNKWHGENKLQQPPCPNQNKRHGENKLQQPPCQLQNHAPCRNLISHKIMYFLNDNIH